MSDSNIRAVVDRVEAANGVAHPDDVMRVVQQLRRFETLLEMAQEKQGPFVAYFIDVPQLIEDVAERGETRALVVSAPGLEVGDLMRFAKAAGRAVLAALYDWPDGEE